MSVDFQINGQAATANVVAQHEACRLDVDTIDLLKQVETRMQKSRLD